MSYLPVHRPAPAYNPVDSASVKLTIRQHPVHALVTHEHKEKGRKPIDPPPIVQMHVDGSHDPNEYWLVNPFLFMMAMLVDPKTEQLVSGNILIGQNVSSLHRLKDLDSKDGGFYVFGDISCRKTGTYKIQFNLYDYDKLSGNVMLVDSIMSNEFKVVSTKDFRGLGESTNLSRHFSDQGVRLRLRKEPRALAGAKRTWNSSPPEPSSPTATTNLYGGPVHSHQGYNVPPLKRQRSNEDYGNSFIYPSYQVRPPHYTGGTSFSSDGSGHGWPQDAKSQQAFSNEHVTSTLTGMMTPTQPPQQQHSTSSLWAAQRGLQMGTYPGAGGGGGVSSSYFPHSTTAARSVSTGGNYLSSYSYAPAVQPYSNLRGSGGTSEAGYGQALTGLHTPTSLSDHGLNSAGSAGGGGASGTASQGGSYLHTAPDVQSQHHHQQQHGAAGGEFRQPMQHFTGRGLTLEQPIAGLHDGGAGSDYLF